MAAPLVPFTPAPPRPAEVVALLGLEAKTKKGRRSQGGITTSLRLLARARGARMAAWRDGDLDVVVAGARKLGKSLGVLVELRLGETAVRTREVKGKREVEFGARFRLRLPPKVDAVGVVVHGTHRLSRSTVLGSASYSLDEVFANGRCDAVCPLLSASGAYAGEVLLLMQFSPRGQGRPPLPPGPSAAVPGVAVGTPAGYVNVKGAAPVQPALAPPVPPGFSALASPSAPSPGPPSPPTQAATYEPKIVEELQALRAGMEELKLQAGDAMAQMTSNVESLHNRVDELEDGYGESRWRTAEYMRPRRAWRGTDQLQNRLLLSDVGRRLGSG